MGSIIGVVLSVALSLAADDLIQRANRLKAKKEGVTLDDVLKIVNDTLDRASQYEGTKSKALTKQLNTLNSRLGALPYNQGVGIVEEKIQEARRNLNNQIADAQDKLTDLAADEAKAQQQKFDLQSRASSLANASDSYKISQSGKDDLAQIKKDAESYVDKIKQINEGVEKYV